MRESLGECTRFLYGEAHIKQALPFKKPYCQYCIFLKYQSGYDRFCCSITNEWILDHKRQRGDECPFTWREKDG